MKIGGGCLKDPRDFLRVADVVRSKDEPLVMVVSAVFGVTNLLINGIKLAMGSDKQVPIIIKNIKERHKQIVEDTINDEDIKQKTLLALQSKIRKLERLLYGVAYTEDITNSVRALIISYGERLAAITIAGVLRSQNIDAEAAESDVIGIITDSSFENATAILPIVKENLQKFIIPLLDKGSVPVITGYFGCTESGKITTFGRNGSDYSAAVVAHCIGALTLEIWKDVDGFMSADPKLVEGTHRIDRLSYYEAAELSYFGAKILHPRTVEPLVDAGIKIHIKNICDPNSRGTEVLRDGYEKKDVLKSVTYNNISVVKIQGSGVGSKPGIIGSIGQKLSEIGVNIYSVITSQTCINLLIDRKDSKISYEALQKLSSGIIEAISVRNDITLVAVVGEGLLRAKGLAAKVFSAVADKEINVEMISAGASEVAYYFIIKEVDLEPAINAIHSKFFAENLPINYK
ncbi:MAG: aspartate kinase [Candidatus Hermodarchaeota archaeon]